MSDGTAHEVSCPDDERLSNSVEGPRWPDSAAVLKALAALEAEFSSILNRSAPVSK
jgi:hypothetical protein